jgi:hypothetical protein
MQTGFTTLAQYLKAGFRVHIHPNMGSPDHRRPHIRHLLRPHVHVHVHVHVRVFTAGEERSWPKVVFLTRSFCRYRRAPLRANNPGSVPRSPMVLYTNSKRDHERMVRG